MEQLRVKTESHESLPVTGYHRHQELAPAKLDYAALYKRSFKGIQLLGVARSFMLIAAGTLVVFSATQNAKDFLSRALGLLIFFLFEEVVNAKYANAFLLRQRTGQRGSFLPTLGAAAIAALSWLPLVLLVLAIPLVQSTSLGLIGVFGLSVALFYGTQVIRYGTMPFAVLSAVHRNLGFRDAFRYSNQISRDFADKLPLYFFFSNGAVVGAIALAYTVATTFYSANQYLLAAICMAVIGAFALEWSQQNMASLYEELCDRAESEGN